MDDVRLFPPKFKYSNFGVLPKDAGILPVILQKLRSRYFNCPSSNNCDGSGPDYDF